MVEFPCRWLSRKQLTNQFHGLWSPEDQCRIHKCSPITPILSRINSTRIDTYFFKMYSNIVPQSKPRPS